MRRGGVDINTREMDPVDLRMRVGMVFQDWALFPHLTVAQNVTGAASAATESPIHRTRSTGVRGNVVVVAGIVVVVEAAEVSGVLDAVLVVGAASVIAPSSRMWSSNSALGVVATVLLGRKAGAKR